MQIDIIYACDNNIFIDLVPNFLKTRKYAL